jgi:hypothetical protein
MSELKVSHADVTISSTRKPNDLRVLTTPAKQLNDSPVADQTDIWARVREVALKFQMSHLGGRSKSRMNCRDHRHWDNRVASWRSGNGCLN